MVVLKMLIGYKPLVKPYWQADIKRNLAALTAVMAGWLGNIKVQHHARYSLELFSTNCVLIKSLC